MKFNGTLNTNEYYNGLFNAYALIQTFADALTGLDSTLADKFRADGGMYKDQSVFTDMDILTSREWDPTDTNVLATEQKVKPVQQTIVLDQKRQIAMTTENYLTKRAWMDEGSFSQFNSVAQSQIGNTKKVYEQRLVDVATGIMEAEMPDGKGSGQAQTVNIPAGTSEELTVRKIGKKIADILVDVKDTTRDFNDYGFVKAYNKNDLMIVWNAAYLNQFNYVDLPTIYHKDGIIDFVGDQLPGRYFGKLTSSADVGEGLVLENNRVHSGAGLPKVRAVVEKTIGTGDSAVHYFPGDIIADNTTVGGSSAAFKYDECYKEDASIICKIMHKNSIKYLSSFESSTEFFNAKNLSQNRYLTWMYAKPDYLRNYPLITLRETNN